MWDQLGVASVEGPCAKLYNLECPSHRLALLAGFGSILFYLTIAAMD